MGKLVELPTVTIARLEAERDELADALSTLCDELVRVTDWKDPALGGRLAPLRVSLIRARLAATRVWK